MYMDSINGFVKRVAFRMKKVLPALLLGLMFSGLTWLPSLGAEGPVVRAVLFYSPACPHCHLVIEEVLVPLFEQYGEQLEMVGVDTSSPGGSQLFGSAIQRFAIPPEQQVVPMLIVGETILLGSYDIPDQFPGLIERHLAQGGIDWPDIPGLSEALAAAPSEPTATPAPTRTSCVSAPVVDIQETPAPAEAQPQSSPTPLVSGLILPDSPPPGLGERLGRDPAGNTLAIIVLLGMLLSIVGILNFLRPITGGFQFNRPSGWIPVLSFLGIGIAAYLAYVETTHVQAVCGPVGDCNTVQQSEYARLFGVLPVGILGLAGYIAILLAWLVGRYGGKRPAQLASLALMVMTVFGVLFSIYLTFLEPFVIGATCAWCVSSAILMTALMWFSVIAVRSPSGELSGRSFPTRREAA
jgi:uncharacterized membrane protein